jgi:hypothetical protein
MFGLWRQGNRKSPREQTAMRPAAVMTWTSQTAPPLRPFFLAAHNPLAVRDKRF